VRSGRAAIGRDSGVSEERECVSVADRRRVVVSNRARLAAVHLALHEDVVCLVEVPVDTRHLLQSEHAPLQPLGPFTTTWVVASNLSVGSGVIVIFSCWAHLAASALFRAGPQGPYPAGYPTATSWRTGHHTVVSRCLSATGICFSAILFPPRN